MSKATQNYVDGQLADLRKATDGVENGTMSVAQLQCVVLAVIASSLLYWIKKTV